MTEPNTPLNAGGAGPGPGRDPRLAGFAGDGAYASALPSAAVTAVLEDLADGTGRPPPEATDDEVIGMLASWQSLEAHANARMLAVLRELIRRRPAPGAEDAYPGNLPTAWDKGAAHEAAAELGVSWQSAAPLLTLAWDLQARLPGIGRLLDEGAITGLKARIISDEFLVLDDEQAADAEEQLLSHDLAAASMTPGRLRKLAQRIADTVDPGGARERREAIERESARVSFFRHHGGSTAMFAEGLPADEALAAEKGIQARALEYRDAGLYPEDKMDCLRVLSMLDLINQVTLADRIARYRTDHDQGQDQDRDAAPSARGPAPPGGAPDDTADDAGNDSDAPGGNGPSPDGSGRGTRGPGLPSLINLTLPLATLLGLAERPGEAPGYGSVDPALVRDLAKAAAASPRTEICFTITDDGHAVGHACARLIRGGAATVGQPGRTGPAPGGWDLHPDTSRPGPEGGYGTWTLTVPGGTRYRLEIHPVPLDRCDHRYATDSYRPGKLLRHLVEVRDGECVSVSCSHPARLSDYEHATPWHKGGRTDACNGGPVSRACHRVKQTAGWDLSNVEPGTHRWKTPSGRTYDKGPKVYPA